MSFNELFDKEEIMSFDSQEAIISTLLSRFDVLNSTQIHKILFLSSVEGEVNIPFTFKKHNYGPFSDEISSLLDTLKENNEINEKSEIKTNFYGSTYPENTISLNKENVEINTEFDKLLEEMFNLLNNRATYLKDKCYEEYYLKYASELDQIYNKRIEMEIENLKEELSILNESIELSISLNDKDKFDILTNLDYLNEILSKNLLELEMVARGIILNKINEFIDLLRNYLFSDNEEDEKEYLIPQIKRKFNYIVNKVVNLDLIENIYDDYS